MSIAEQITRLINAKKSIKASIENKGVVVSEDVLLDEYSALIDSIETDNGGGTTYLNPDFYSFRTNGGTNLSNLFAYSTFTELDLTSLDVSKATSFYFMFRNCTSLVTLDISTWDWGDGQTLTYVFQQCTALVEIYPPQNISNSLSLTSSPNLSYDSIVRIINNLKPGENRKLTLHATALAKVTEEDMAAALDKGWTIS